MYLKGLSQQSGLIWISLLTILYAAQSSNDTAELIYRYQPTTWIENLGVRPKGWLLPIATLGTSAILNQLKPATGELEQVYDFSAAGNAIQCITEVEPDLFVVNALTCNITALDCTQGSVSTWRVDLPNESRTKQGNRSAAYVDEITTFPDAGFLNGMTALDSRTVLIADNFLGGVWSLDIWTGDKRLVFADPSMNGTAADPTGINGVRVRPGELYSTNSAVGTFNRIPIDPEPGNKTGDAVVIASGLSAPDDFEVDLAGGVAYVSAGTANQLLRIELDSGDYEAAADVPGPTSARWGAAGELYVSSAGPLLQYVTGKVTLGGGV